MSDQILVGVDCGTTSIKAVAVALDGTIQSSASRPTPWHHQGPNSDIDPRLLAETAVAVCAEAADAAGASPVAGIGVTGIAECGVLLDPQGEPCAPALAWFDPRGDAAPIREVVTRAEFQRATGRRLNSKPSFAKIMWLYAHVPSARAAVRHLCVAEWVVRAMGGEEVSEASLTSRTGLMEISTREPWAVADELVGRLLPERRVWAGEAAGTSGWSVPEHLRGATLTVAGLDHQAAMIALGAAREGALLDSIGTAEALTRTVTPLSTSDIERLTDEDIDVDWAVVPDHQIMLAGRVTGLTLERVCAMLGVTTREARRELGEAALAVERDVDSPRLTELSNDSFTLAHLTDGVSPALVWRCVVEDLVAYVGSSLDLMTDVAGPHRSSMLIGGWSRNPMVAHAKRGQLGHYNTSDLQEPGAIGAAFMAGVAAGLLERPASDAPPAWLA